MTESMICQDCKMTVTPPNAYHPFLYCLLYKLGNRDPEAYLRSYGFERVKEREGERE